VKRSGKKKGSIFQNSKDQDRSEVRGGVSLGGGESTVGEKAQDEEPQVLHGDTIGPGGPSLNAHGSTCGCRGGKGRDQG